MNKLPGLVFSLLLSLCLSAQKPPSYHAGEIQQKLNKLNVLGTVLYVAAHPDDENTSVIAYFANEELFRTAYLSATRGDGGQNLIGPEIREGLGLIRTQELLAARRTDGGQQFFSRANDFGYSKHPDETLTIWEKDKVLADFVRVYRQFRPDIIITRFNIAPGETHGHHTTSAMLAKEAFEKAGDPNAFPDQLKELEPWQPQKIFWNTSPWFFARSDMEFDTAAYKSLEIGAFNPLLGQSYNEISALSRSMHKSQGFGSVGSRGSDMQFFEQWDGEDTGEMLDGIDFTWNRVKGSEGVSEFLKKASESYDPRNPYDALANLYKGREELMKLPDQFWKEIKLKEIDEAVAAITGTYLEVIADDYSYVKGDSIGFEMEVISRGDVDFELVELSIDPIGFRNEFNQSLESNEKITADFFAVVPELPFSHPYWLNEQATLGMYHVEDESKIGKPENDPVFNARFTIKWEDQYLEFERPVFFKRRDPVDGEVYRPVEIAPPAMVNLSDDIVIFGNDEARQIEARVIAGKAGAAGTLKFDLPEGWKITPEQVDFQLVQENQEKLFTFSLKPPTGADESTLTAVIEMEDGSTFSRGRDIIDYDHIPVQTLYPLSSTKLVKLDLQKRGNLIGYIEGAGDVIPENLRQIGYDVNILSKDEVTAENLQSYDAVILGIRAFNTIDWLSYKNQELFKYVEKGGTVIVQYNTNRGLVTEEVAPYDLQISRDRVAVEEAEVRILEPQHAVLNSPNKITNKDFEGWVQERGLYFPDKWDENFKAILSSNDPGEDPRDGGLLVASYGEGYYIYSGYSWFRELPAGVPGAYRLFVNLISIGQNKQQ